jgi:hypothetical protein
MTTRKVNTAMNMVTSASDKGFYLEALLRTYHMNLSLMKHILASGSSGAATEGKKLKPFLKKFFKNHKRSEKLKSTISSQSVKSLQVWLEKTDTFFRTLKMRQPANTKQLLEESTRIAGMLSISLNKVGAAKKRAPRKAA